MKSESLFGFIVLVCVCLVGAKALSQHREAHQIIAGELKYQCGHTVFFRAAQLIGVPLSKKAMDQLPLRKSGVSLKELELAFSKIGFEARIHFGTDLSSLSPLAVCKLDRPSHFVLVQSHKSEDNSFLVYNGMGRPEKLTPSRFKERFNGYWLELTPKRIFPLVRAESSGPIPRFRTLLMDAGELDYLAKAGDYVEFEFDYTNAGDRTLEIVGVSTSCECTQHEVSQQKVEPGEAGSIKVHYRPTVGNADGVFRELIWVKTNSEEFPMVRLEVSGAFPGRISTRPKSIDFGVVKKKSSKFVFVDVPPGSITVESVSARIRDKRNADGCDVVVSSINEYNKYQLALCSEFIEMQEREGLKVFRIDVASPSENSTYKDVLWVDFYVDGNEAPVSSSQITRFKGFKTP